MSRYELYVPALRDWPRLWWQNFKPMYDWFIGNAIRDLSQAHKEIRDGRRARLRA